MTTNIMGETMKVAEPVPVPASKGAFQRDPCPQYVVSTGGPVRQPGDGAEAFVARHGEALRILGDS